jgi:GTPase SAR1 family protein
MDALSDVLSLGSKEQHQRIDKLRELGVAEDISLPQVRASCYSPLVCSTHSSQLVVVGDQSSGKSSLLEGLTDLPFPTAADVCTRFATRIVFRRLPLPEDTTSLSIIPGPNATAGHKERLEVFSKDFAGYRLTRENFKDTIGQVSLALGRFRRLLSLG